MTLVNEICVQWAKDRFLAEDFDVVVLIPSRSAQGRSIEDVVAENIGGEEAYWHLKKSSGAKCLIILEGLHKIAISQQQNDNFLMDVIQACIRLTLATFLITSRPHACEKISRNYRRVEIVGFGKKTIQEFVEKSIDDIQTVKEFLVQLKDFPHIYGLCYIPLNLVMAVNIFKEDKKLPSTMTELYRLFIITNLQKHLKQSEGKPLAAVVVPAAKEEILLRMLNGIPKEAVRTVFALSKLAYHGFFNQCSKEGQWKKKDPKIIFTSADLIQCGVEVTTDCGLLECIHNSQLPTDTITFSFVHLTIQEFLCAVYMSTLSNEEQQHMLSEHFDDYHNVLAFLCGLTGLESHKEMSQFIYKMIQNKSRICAAIQCAFEGQAQLTSTSLSATPFIDLDISYHILQPYECLCLSHILLSHSVFKLNMGFCHIGDAGVEMLSVLYCSKNSSGQVLHNLCLHRNNLTVTGIGHVMNIMMKSKCNYMQCFLC